MALASFCSETVSVIRAPLIDVRGTRERDWSRAAAHGVAGCSVQPSSTSTDRGDAREASSESVTVYAPPGADIEEGDRIVCRLGEFAVDGIPQRWESPTGAVSHTVVQASRWRG